MFDLGDEACVDESGAPCKGRQIGWGQCNPAKPAKRHVKIFVLCSVRTGHVWAFSCHAGKSNYEFGGARERIIVDDLMQNCEGDGCDYRTMYTDNW